MTRRHRALPLVLLLLAAVVLAACGGQSAAPAQPAAKAPAAAQPAAPAAPATPPPAGGTVAVPPAPAKAAVPPEQALKLPAMTKVGLRMHFPASITSSPWWLGIDQGFFKELNIDLSIHDANGSVASIQTVGGGGDDFGYAAYGTLVIGRSDLPVKAIATIMQQSDACVCVPINSGINSPKDLVGKTILYAPGSFGLPFLPMLLKKNGVDPSQVKQVGISAAAQYTQYASGQGDALSAAAPPSIFRSRSLRPTKALLFQDWGIPMHGAGLFTTDKMIQTRPEVVRAFVYASLKSWDYAATRLKEAVEAQKKRYPPQNLQDGIDQLAMNYKDYRFNADTKGKPPGIFLPDKWEKAVDALLELDLIKKKLPNSDYFTNDFIPGYSR